MDLAAGERGGGGYAHVAGRKCLAHSSVAAAGRPASFGGIGGSESISVPLSGDSGVSLARGCWYDGRLQGIGCILEGDIFLLPSPVRSAEEEKKYSFVLPVNEVGQSGENLTLMVSELWLLSDGVYLTSLLGFSCKNVKLCGRLLLAEFDI
jgi:hypothetical protein